MARKAKKGKGGRALIPFLYGILAKSEEGTRLRESPRKLGTYQAFSVARAAEAVIGLWTREEIKGELEKIVDRDDLFYAPRFHVWLEREGRIGITKMDRAVKKPPKKLVDEISDAGKRRTKNLTMLPAYDSENSRYGGTLSHNIQLTMGVKSRSRGNYQDTPPVRQGSIHRPLFARGHMLHPNMAIGSCCQDSGEHSQKIRDYFTYVWCYHSLARLTRAYWEANGKADLTIAGLKLGARVALPFDFLKVPEMAFDQFARRYVDGQSLWEISFEMAEHYERFTTQEFTSMLREGGCFFGLIPYARNFSAIADSVKEAAIRAIWKRDDYYFLGHGIERVREETNGLWDKPIESFIYMKKEGHRDLPQRKRVHIVVNSDTDGVYYVIKVPQNMADGVFTSTAKPLAKFEEADTAFRNDVVCAVYEIPDKILGPKLAREYREIKENEQA